MYTSGCPKIQNRCCHSSELPPSSGVKKWYPNPRSSSRNKLPTISGVNANSTMKPKINIDHPYSGMRVSVMPGVLSLRTAMMISIAPAIAPISAVPSPSTQKSRLRSGEKIGPLNGV